MVDGVRSADVAKELALKAPLSLGRARTLDGQAVDAIDGTQSFGKKSEHVVLYVRAKGTHVPVEEDSVNAKGQDTDCRAHRLFQVGRTGATRGAQGHDFRRLDKRCLRKRPNDPDPYAGTWEDIGSHPWPSRRSPRHRAGPPGE